MGGFHHCLEPTYTPDQYNISAETHNLKLSTFCDMLPTVDTLNLGHECKNDLAWQYSTNQIIKIDFSNGVQFNRHILMKLI